jgi:hypothetical protein
MAYPFFSLAKSKRITSASSTNDMVRQGSSPPTMQGPDATKITSRRIDRCRVRPKILSRHSRRGLEVNKLMVRLFSSRIHSRQLAHPIRSVSNPSNDRPRPGVRPDRQPSGRAAVDLSTLVPQSDNLFAHPANESRLQ